MPTNEERREVAARLRKNEPSSFGSLFDVWREIALAVNPSGGSYKTLPLELADLIEPDPERTCKAIDDFMLPGQVQTYPYKICSNCHSDFPRLVMGDGFLVENYCPNCGAKVVS